MTRTTRSARCSITSCCTRPSSGSRPRTSCAHAGEGLPDIVIGSCGGGSNLGGISLPFVPDAGVRSARRRTVLVPDAHGGDLRVRLRRRRQDDTAPAHVQPRSRVHAAVDPRRGAALPRRRADHLDAREKRAGCGRSPIRRARSSRRPSQFARTQGTIPAPETAHAIRAVIDEALAAKETGRGEGDPLLLLGPRAAWTSAPTTTTCTGGSTPAEPGL